MKSITCKGGGGRAEVRDLEKKKKKDKASTLLKAKINGQDYNFSN